MALVSSSRLRVAPMLPHHAAAHPIRAAVKPPVHDLSKVWPPIVRTIVTHSADRLGY